MYVHKYIYIYIYGSVRFCRRSAYSQKQLRGVVLFHPKRFTSKNITTPYSVSFLEFLWLERARRLHLIWRNKIRGHTAVDTHKHFQKTTIPCCLIWASWVWCVFAAWLSQFCVLRRGASECICAAKALRESAYVCRQKYSNGKTQNTAWIGQRPSPHISVP